MDADLGPLEARLGYYFRNRELLNRALTHKSRAFERNPGSDGAQESNEQLEFLGDSILGFIVSEALVERFPAFAEGQLSKWKARLVSSDHLYLGGAGAGSWSAFAAWPGRGNERRQDEAGTAGQCARSADWRDTSGRRPGTRARVRPASHRGRAGPPQPELSAMPFLILKVPCRNLRNPASYPLLVTQSLLLGGLNTLKLFTVDFILGSDWSARAEATIQRRPRVNARRNNWQQMIAVCPHGVTGQNRGNVSHRAILRVPKTRRQCRVANHAFTENVGCE